MPGTYLIPGVGQVVISVALLIVLGKQVIETRTEIFNKVQVGIASSFCKRSRRSKKRYSRKIEGWRWQC